MAVEKATVVGTVEATNQTGIKVDGAWLNYSKHVDVPRPAKGQRVTLVVSGGKWIEGLELLDAPAGNGHPAGASAERRMLRSVAIKAAANFLSARPEAKREHLFKLAEEIELWLEREERA